MEINIPHVHAQISSAFWAYAQALIDNDIDTVTQLFWNSEHCLRFGARENLYGIEEIAKFRLTQKGKPLALEIQRLEVVSFGTAFGTANCEMLRPDIPGVGRMSHTWVRLPEGWRITAAHVSNLPIE